VDYAQGKDCKGKDYSPNQNTNNGNAGGNGTTQQAMLLTVGTNNSPTVHVNKAMKTIVEYSGFSD
jgi:hypothetical protein